MNEIRNYNKTNALHCFWKCYFAIVDIDECKDATADCDHNCINTDGGYNCECEIGYALHDLDRRTCQRGVDFKIWE